jgi:hypothetical protein
MILHVLIAILAGWVNRHWQKVIAATLAHPLDRNSLICYMFLENSKFLSFLQRKPNTFNRIMHSKASLL